MSPTKSPSRRFPFVVTFTTLALFGFLVAGLTLWLRERLRTEVLQREAEAINAVALMELASAKTRTPALVSGDSAAVLFSAVLESSRLRGVMAVQLFDAAGLLQTALPDTGIFNATTRWWALDLSKPTARFHANASLEEIFGAEVEPGATPTRVPVLEIIVPLHLTSKANAIARYWIAGDSVALEFTRMDYGLFGQAGLAYLGTAILVGAVLTWAFRRLAAANRRLSAQSADLARANQELNFAAKTGAIGAISAHLIHGLKNPLAGLESFVTDPSVTTETEHGEAWKSAVDTTRRLRTMVQEVMSVLRDEADGHADYPVPIQELLIAAQNRMRTSAESAGVTTVISESAEGVLLARTANLASLILSNLMGNAIDASPRGGLVKLSSRQTDRGMEIFVEDTGRGFTPDLRATLFQPVRSTKQNGSGVGLAISRQLARHTSGDLELVRSNATGTVFCIRLPLMNGELRSR